MKKLFLLLLISITLLFSQIPKTYAYSNNTYLIVITNSTGEFFVYDIYEDSFITYDYDDIDIDDIVDYTIIRPGDFLQYHIEFDSFDYFAYDASYDPYLDFNEIPRSILGENYDNMWYWADNVGSLRGYAAGLIAGQLIVEEDAYNNGFGAGVDVGYKLANDRYYDNIENWLVPAIIVVMFLGGIFTFVRLKRNEE
jgi:hypothetical protein